MNTASSCAAMPAVAIVAAASAPRWAPRAGWFTFALPRRVAQAARAALVAWRAEQRERAVLRSLVGIDRRVLRDVGLADRVPPPSGPDWRDLERGRW